MSFQEKVCNSSHSATCHELDTCHVLDTKGAAPIQVNHPWSVGPGPYVFVFLS